MDIIMLKSGQFVKIITVLWNTCTTYSPSYRGIKLYLDINVTLSLYGVLLLIIYYWLLQNFLAFIPKHLNSQS